MATHIKIKQIRSAIGCPQKQRDTLLGLGLTRNGRIRILLDTTEIRGMIRKVAHLVAIEPHEKESE
jgi:large subunit ribosomal protein L30